MKILVVSDIHYELKPHRGVDESGAFDWLKRKVEWLKPESLVGLGDWGRAWTESQWELLAKLCKISTIYGNHDNIELLGAASNTDGSPMLANDGEVRKIGSLRFGFINGIISESRSMKEGVPRKSEREYLGIGFRLSGIDVLCTHESPYFPEYGNRVHESPGTRAVENIIEMVKPKLALSGHLSGPYIIARIGDILCLRVDSSPVEKHFAVLEFPSRKIRIYHDWTLVSEISIN